MVSKHEKPSAKNPQGGIVKKKLLSISQTFHWLIQNLEKQLV